MKAKKIATKALQADILEKWWLLTKNGRKKMKNFEKLAYLKKETLKIFYIFGKT